MNLGKCQMLLYELMYFRKLMLNYRSIHFIDYIPNIDIEIVGKIL